MKSSSLNKNIRNIDSSIIGKIKNRMTQNKIIWMSLDKIIIDPEIENIFIQKETDIQNIANNMIENQKNHKSPFDPAHPIILAHSKEHPELNNINVDGHTRYKAAKRANISMVAIIYREFVDKAEIVRFVYQRQLLRRNLGEGELFNAWAALNRLTNENGRKVKSDTEIAEELQISRRQVAKMKEVEKKATPEVLESIKSGELSVNKAYTQIKQIEAKTTESHSQVDNENALSDENDGFVQGFKNGYKYVYESLKLGRTTKDLQVDAIALKEGKVTAQELLQKLQKYKESHEQKQTE